MVNSTISSLTVPEIKETMVRTTGKSLQINTPLLPNLLLNPKKDIKLEYSHQETLIIK